jgi:hypothetical protein
MRSNTRVLRFDLPTETEAEERAFEVGGDRTPCPAREAEPHLSLRS